MAKYRKLPVEIDAFKWTGDIDQKEDPQWCVDKIHDGTVTFPNSGAKDCTLQIKTLEGVMTANQGYYIIKGVNGEIYPCKPDIFEKTYEKVI